MKKIIIIINTLFLIIYGQAYAQEQSPIPLPDEEELSRIELNTKPYTVPDGRAPFNRDIKAPADAEALYIEICGECHIPYEPKYITKYGWAQLMSDVQVHFGTDASKKLIIGDNYDHIEAYLQENSNFGYSGPTITESDWFLDIHSGLLRQAEIEGIKMSSCNDCHE